MRLRADRREERVREAEERNAYWRSLTLNDRITIVVRRRGFSDREIKRLLLQVPR